MGQFELGRVPGDPTEVLTDLAILLRATHAPTTNPAIAQVGGVKNKSPRGLTPSVSGDRHQPIIAPAIVNSAVDLKNFVTPPFYTGTASRSTAPS